MATTDQVSADPGAFRMQVVAESIRLFAAQGYEATTVDEVAAAAGVSRRTLFRQFHSKEDLIFADHESLLEQVGELLTGAAPGDDPWWSVCAAAELVFAHFHANRELAVRRYRVVADVAALRDRELVTTYRYQRLFEDHLRSRLPAVRPVQIVAYAAAVTGAHNFLLRSMLRGDPGADAAALRGELVRLHRTAVAEPGAAGAEIAVVSYPAGTSPEAIAEAVRTQLTQLTGTPCHDGLKQAETRGTR